jgi:GT2 family glycosyltransferase
MKSDITATIVIPCGPATESILDTAESIEHYCPEPHNVVFVDDHTTDGTYETLLSAKRHNWHILRNSRTNGIYRLTHSLCEGFRYVLSNLSCHCILRLDQDALLIRSGVITDALKYISDNPSVGLFGVYDTDYSRPRDFTFHRKTIRRETMYWRKILGLQPFWAKFLRPAEANGYSPGENVFGGAYFITRSCLTAIEQIGGLDVPYRWHSRLMEDVYFSMVTVAAGYKLGHFAAPNGPLCLEWRGLPYPAELMWQKGYKVVHSVDKGPNTTSAENSGYTAREVFRNIRETEPNSTGKSV